MSTELRIPRHCNKCGKPFLYIIDDEELHQQKQSIEYICDECLYGVVKVPDVGWIEKLEKFIDLLIDWDLEHPGRYYAYYLNDMYSNDRREIADILRRACNGKN
jgi:hypothetical protein